MTIKEFVSNLNIGEDAFLIFVVIGTAWVQMKKIEQYQHNLEVEFIQYIDNSRQIQTIANQVISLRNEISEYEFDYRSLYAQYTTEKNYNLELEKQLRELQIQNEELKKKSQ